MVTQKTKFRISIEKLNIEYEGTQEGGRQIQQDVTQALGGLMNTQNRLLATQDEPARAEDSLIIDATPSQGNGQSHQDVGNGNGEKTKQPRQRRSKNGPSVSNLLLVLKQEGYFSQVRTSSDVLDHLKVNKGHTLPETTVRTELQRMVQKDDADAAKLHRSKNDKVYVYKDTPINEVLRSSSPPEEPAQ